MWLETHADCNDVLNPRNVPEILNFANGIRAVWRPPGDLEDFAP